MKVFKRDNYTEIFDRTKIEKALLKAFDEVDESNVDKYIEIDLIASHIETQCEVHPIVNIEQIQDLIEEDLLERGFFKIARAFISHRDKMADRRSKGWEMDDLQKSIFDKKYNSEKLSFDKWLDRVSNKNPKVKKLIRDKKFLFAGRILAHRGTPEKVTYSNCYVIEPPKDDLFDIFDTAKYLARTYSYGGGCGTDISKLRPRDAKVNNSAKETTGAVSFMKLYDLTTHLIGQNGRRGALMLSISDKHPDLMEFIDIKRKVDEITSANISIRISDDFMRAVEQGIDWTLSFTVEDTGEVIERTYNAEDIYHKICLTNWDWAEVGFLYWDRIEGWHLMSEHLLHKFAGVNPCAEEPLMAGGSCLLGSSNLSRYILYPFTDKSRFDFDKYGQDVRIAITGLNEVLDEGMERHPLREQRENARLWRQIGLGVMGIADMLIKLGLEYGGDESLELCSRIARLQLNQALTQSALLAKEFGTFPMYDYESLCKSKFYQENVDDDVKELIKKYGLRNSQLMTIAPTGTGSTMWGVSGGIEPIFDISYTRKTESLFGEDVYFEVFTPIIRQYMELKGLTDKSQLPSFILNSTAHHLDYKKRIRMQSVWQRFIDASISSTINLPKETTVWDVEDLYKYAWEQGLKGLTVFRNGCKRMGVLTTESKDDTIKEEVGQATEVDKYVVCKDCGEPIKVITNGCSICMNCGYSPCN